MLSKVFLGLALAASTVAAQSDAVSSTAVVVAPQMTTANGLSCPVPLNICTVYDPVTTPSGPQAVCFNSTQYVCTQPSASYQGQFLCPNSASNLCGRSCYSSQNYTCQVDDSNVYDSQLEQLFSLGGVTFATYLRALPNNTFQLSFMPQNTTNSTGVNYVIVHYQSVALNGNVQQNKYQSLTYTSSGTGYTTTVTLPAGTSILYSFTFQNGQGLQYDTNGANVITQNTVASAQPTAAASTDAPTTVATTAAATTAASSSNSTSNGLPSTAVTNGAGSSLASPTAAQKDTTSGAGMIQSSVAVLAAGAGLVTMLL